MSNGVVSVCSISFLCIIPEDGQPRPFYDALPEIVMEVDGTTCLAFRK